MKKALREVALSTLSIMAGALIVTPFVEVYNILYPPGAPVKGTDEFRGPLLALNRIRTASWRFGV